MSDMSFMTYSPRMRTQKAPQPAETTRTSGLVDHHDDMPPAKVRCPQCGSRLEVIETPSGARTVSVVFLAAAVENTAHGLESFMAPGDGPELICPACRKRFDPAEPSSAIRPLKRK
jgi:DNA-directed RNA polymerase subunit RPC12/RpoP